MEVNRICGRRKSQKFPQPQPLRRKTFRWMEKLLFLNTWKAQRESFLPLRDFGEGKVISWCHSQHKLCSFNVCFKMTSFSENKDNLNFFNCIKYKTSNNVETYHVPWSVLIEITDKMWSLVIHRVQKAQKSSEVWTRKKLELNIFQPFFGKKNCES